MDPLYKDPPQQARFPPVQIKRKQPDFQVTSGLFFFSNPYFYPTAPLSACFSFFFFPAAILCLTHPENERGCFCQQRSATRPFNHLEIDFFILPLSQPHAHVHAHSRAFVSRKPFPAPEPRGVKRIQSTSRTGVAGPGLNKYGASWGLVLTQTATSWVGGWRSGEGKTLRGSCLTPRDDQCVHVRNGS